ncbi:MAG TPA: hypothetical protein VFW00_03965, partial [Rhodocyclaceae bacterium]|nr:hypothetical protein [Rhodocyclaceae bacterium]
MTSLLPPVEMGIAALVTSCTAFFALFFVNPIGMFINRRLHAWVASGAMRRYFHLYCGYLLVVAFVAGMLVWLGAASGILRLGVSPDGLALLVAASLLFNTINQTLVPSLNMVGRVAAFMALTLLTLLAGLLCSFALGHFLNKHSAETWLAGALCAQALFAAIAYVVFFRNQVSVSNSPAALRS